MSRPNSNSIAALVAAVVSLTACADPEQVASIKDTTRIATTETCARTASVSPMCFPASAQQAKIGKATPALTPTKSVPGNPIPEDLVTKGYYSAKCYFLNRDCLRCDAYLSDADRASILEQVEHYRSVGPEKLAERLGRKLTEWRSQPKPEFGRRLPLRLERFRTGMIVDAIVLGDVVNHDGRYVGLIQAVADAVRCTLR